MLRRSFKLLVATVFLISFSSISAAEIEVRRVTPPKLEANYLGQKILCHRPMRHGAPNLSIEQQDNKIVINNYGHGGSGWTLGPGSANYVINLLVNSEYARDLEKNTPISIIGAGAIGLFTAYTLHQQGFTDITIIADRFEGLTSHNAGGLLAPVSMDNNPEMQQIINQIGIDAYTFYKAIAVGDHTDFSQGAMVVPSYFEKREDSGLEPYVGKVMQPAKDVILDFGNGTTRNMVAYDDGIFIDTAKMMVVLTKHLKQHNIKFVKKKLSSLAEVSSKFVINCSGLGAAQLNADSAVEPVQGHLIMLKDQTPKDLEYMILVYFGNGETKGGQKVTRSFYIFPKHMPGTGTNDVGVIGGTFIEGATRNTPNEEEFEIMLENAKRFYGI